MEAIAAAGEAFFTNVFEELLDKLKASHLINFARKKRVFKEHKKWEAQLRVIKALLSDTEDNKQVTSRLDKILLGELRDLTYDMEDLLELFEYVALRRKSSTTTHAQPRSSAASSTMDILTALISTSAVSFNIKMGSEMKRISKRLEDIATHKRKLDLGGGNVGGKACNVLIQRQPTRETSSVPEVNVFGRKEEKGKILEWLLAEQTTSDTQITVVNITGMAGIGKTTLAQMVYNDPKVHHLSKAWVHVRQDFDVTKITKDILQAVAVTSTDVKEMDLLQLKLKEKLSAVGKKLLLVLDDVWHLNYDDWTLLIRPFEVTNSGCKIIITTRYQNVSQMTSTVSLKELASDDCLSILACHPLGSKSFDRHSHLKEIGKDVSQMRGTVSLKELASDDCLSILACHALGSESFDRHPHLEEIGKEIVKKCGGLPQAVKTVARILRTKLDYGEWEAVSRRKMRDLTGEKEGIFPALMLSYDDLPSHLKRCFAYCSLFPKDFEFDSDELVLLWIAEGFVQPNPRENMQLEDVGRQYFYDLLSRSFFHQSDDNKWLFRMHDLNIDLAQSVAKDVCFIMEHELQLDVEKHHLEHARHVSFIHRPYDVAKWFEILNEMKRVRSLLALPRSDQRKYCHLSSKVLNELLSKLERLRVLSLSGYYIGDQLPSSIGNLKLLRYLDLSKTAIRFLPGSVGALLFLRILILKQCDKLTELPAEIGRLIHLLWLDISDTPKLQKMPTELGKLTNLRVLPKFIIGEAGGLTLRDLKDLSRLQGQFFIFNLHHVVNVQDAKVANLKQKHGIKELTLEWNDANYNQLPVLEALQPPSDIKRLSISGYGATSFPYWVRCPLLANIEQLDLYDCINCPTLPSLGRLPSLKKLNIRGMSAVKSLGPDFYGEGYSYVKSKITFPSLMFLRFENMPKWNQWWIPPVGNEEVFPHLRELILYNCPELAELPRSLCSLEKLDVQKCPQLMKSPLSFSSLRELTIEDSSQGILRSMVGYNSITKLKMRRISDLSTLAEEVTKVFRKLEVLEIDGCKQPTCLWQKESELENLPSLKTLVIKNCPKLVSLVGEIQGLFRLSSLKNFRIESCQNFVSLQATGLLCKLNCLKVPNCMALESLPDTFAHHCLFKEIEELEITGCPSFRFFPEGKLPSTLKRLKLENCRNIQFLPDGIARSDDHDNSFEILRLTNCLVSETFQESVLPFSHLKLLCISKCRNLRALPNHMQHLTALQELSLSDCEALTSIPEGCLPPNITSLEFRNCEMLKQHMSEWGLERLNCLAQLKIFGSCPAADMVYFPDDEGMMLPTNLTNLCMGSLNNLESLSRGIGNLTVLEELCIEDCPNLRSLPKTGLPDTLGRLCISGCPSLKDKFLKERRRYQHIPCLELK